ncbi:MAG: hypothetical protein ACRD8A_17255 [Candidatus Acidiferrales bacterium]
MSFNSQFDRVAFRVSHFQQGTILIFALICLATGLRARQIQPVVGNIQGDGVSIASGPSAISVPHDAAATAPIANGGVVTLGPGQARLMLTLGGEIDICGPAKFTLLQSGEAITVALDLGTLRLQLRASTTLRVFTPTIIATPVDINGAPDDITLMLGQDDSLCVKAATGALLLESQFTNEKIVVPQTGQFWFEQGRLVPVARSDLNCECLLPEARFVPSPSPAAPPITDAMRAQIAAAAPSSSQSVTPESERQAEESGVEYSILAHPNDSHPVASQPKASPTQPPDLMPFYRVDMPPLAFSASSPVPPPASAEQMILLIRTTQVNPDFEFTGHVNPPRVEANAKSQSAKSAHTPHPKSPSEKRGFWGRLKRFFVGGGS